MVSHCSLDLLKQVLSWKRWVCSSATRISWTSSPLPPISLHWSLPAFTSPIDLTAFLSVLMLLLYSVNWAGLFSSILFPLTWNLSGPLLLSLLHNPWPCGFTSVGFSSLFSLLHMLWPLLRHHCPLHDSSQLVMAGISAPDPPTPCVLCWSHKQISVCVSSLKTLAGL